MCILYAGTDVTLKTPRKATSAVLEVKLLIQSQVSCTVSTGNTNKPTSSQIISGLNADNSNVGVSKSTQNCAENVPCIFTYTTLTMDVAYTAYCTTHPSGQQLGIVSAPESFTTPGHKYFKSLLLIIF